MPKVRRDKQTGALIFTSTPEDLEIRDLRNRLEILEKKFSELEQINKDLLKLVFEVCKDVRDKGEL